MVKSTKKKKKKGAKLGFGSMFHLLFSSFFQHRKKLGKNKKGIEL